MGVKFPWKRFWADRETEITLSGEGYLEDPDRVSVLGVNETLRTLGELRDRRCLVLLGEAGIGKTSDIRGHVDEMRQRASGDERVLYFDLKEFGSESFLVQEVFGHPEFLNWKAGAGSLELFLDSLDEALLSIETIGHLLARELAKYSRDRLLFRVACRTGAWQSFLEEPLKSLWEPRDVHVMKMAPLRLLDVEEALRLSNIEDQRSFFEEVSRVGAVSFAVRPVTLGFLIGTFFEDRKLPSSQTDLYERGCRVLCQEDAERCETGRAGRLAPDQRLAVAGRLAALTLFGARAAISSDPQFTAVLPEDLSIDVVLQGYDRFPDRPVPLTRLHVLEVLATGLFAPRGQHRTAWAHHSYTEFLAARYLIERGVPTKQLLSLLVHPGDPRGRIVPQLAGVAAWLASMSPEVFRAVTRSNPDLMLWADAARLEDCDRKELVDTLLRMFSEEQLNREWELYPAYSRLAHPGLGAQLEPFLRPDSGRVARFVAIEIAEACRVAGLAQKLVDIALDRSAEPRIRASAVSAAGRIGESSSLNRLRTLVYCA